MRFRLTEHVQEEIVRRSISRAVLDEVLNHPQQVVDGYGGRRAYQSKVVVGDGRMLLIRAIVDDRVDPAVVVTAYRTSKINKYWSHP